ncbi:MAG: hypothetical protein CME06_13075 [Gemmatimonadetes bacterium]|nr:hypothetical protein [Gemmatimonadota bacterium]
MKISRLAIFAAFAWTLGAGPWAQSATAGQRGFVGVKKCKLCHKNEDQGNQYGQWQASAHAKAYETLGTEKAKEAAAGIGVDDPQDSPKCLRCHVTAFTVREKIATEKITLEEGVSCESCHGAGKGYFKKKTMQAIADGKIDRASVGLTKPDATVCAQCHNEDNPFHKGFDFDASYAKIAHPRPAEGATAADKTTQ